MLKGFLPDLWLKFCVRDRFGDIIHQHEEKGHSWTRNAYNFYFGLVAGCALCALPELKIRAVLN